MKTVTEKVTLQVPHKILLRVNKNIVPAEIAELLATIKHPIKLNYMQQRTVRLCTATQSLVFSYNSVLPTFSGIRPASFPNFTHVQRI